MTLRHVSLHDRTDLSKDTVLLSGTQALVRLMLVQGARDRTSGLRTAGYVTGYRGSPLGGVDREMERAAERLAAADIRFQPGVNEDTAATAVWGTQQAGLRGDGRFDGVFSLFYAKGPGVDRSGDVLRHANLAGTHPRGGVVMAMGDDHTGESSTTCHQSEWAVMDAWIPVLSPAGVQEILDYGLYGFALSRFAGVWAGLKLMKDTVEVTSVVDGRPDRMAFLRPEFEFPPDGVSIRLGDTWGPQETRLIEVKREATIAFARENGIDRRIHGRPGAAIGIAAAGKTWLDVAHALELLGIDAEAALRIGLTTRKIGQVFPLETGGLAEWADGLSLLLVVEEKRKIIEGQVKEALYGRANAPRVWGWRDGDGRELFPATGALDPVGVAIRIGETLLVEGRAPEGMTARLERLRAAKAAEAAPDLAARTPYFCAGCPHNTSTKTPDGSRSYGGIGCHILALWMDRGVESYTHMGGEGAQWVGEAPFVETPHVFQQIGDGTYNHSGLMSIRHALAAGTTMTFKILYNDAVALTGGQLNDGGLTPDRLARELLAMGVARVAVVYDPKEEPRREDFPAEVGWHPRDEMPAVMLDLREVGGVTAILYVQTCAAEKRRRRRAGRFPDPDRRVWINPEVCEGCGDCGVQSNCVAIQPLETPLGRKRRIDQSACNKDFSCLEGFCPAFVTVEGGRPRREARALETATPPEPRLPEIDGTHNIVVTGIGGTGVVTIGAVLAMAAHLEGRGAAMMEMAGLAQKGGAVHIHCRIAERPADITAIRLAAGEADVLLGGDLVVAGGAKTLGLLAKGRTAAVINSFEAPTGAFTRDRDFRLPATDLDRALSARLGAGMTRLAATRLAEAVHGDAIFANMVVLGAAWQKGLIPVTRAAIEEAVALNGVAVKANLAAFATGRQAAHDPEAAARFLDAGSPALPRTTDEIVELRAAHLAVHSSERVAARYRAMVARAGEDDALRRAIAEGYHKVLAVKDEYEVARLHLRTAEQVAETFEGAPRITHHLAPPFLGGTGPDGRPRKRAFGSRVGRIWPILAAMKGLRGTVLDPFARSAERRADVAAIRQYEADMAEILDDPARAPEAARALARLPLTVLGFGPVRQAARAVAEAERARLLSQFRAGQDAPRLVAE